MIGRPAAGRAATSVAGLAVAVVFALPFAYLAWRAGSAPGEVWAALTSDLTWGPLWRTVQLTVIVTVAATALGVALAWLVQRTDLPGRSLWRVVVALPLVIPSFVAGAAWMFSWQPGGVVEEVLGVAVLSDPGGLLGASVVLTLVSYPYVYLPVAARLISLPPSLEEGARLLGRSPREVFRAVVLPQCIPAIAAGSLFVALYSVSDFGAVQFVRFDTLTRRLFDSQLRRPEVATAMGVLLAALALLITVGERWVVRRSPPTAGVGGKVALRMSLGKWRLPALAFVALATLLALAGPIGVMAWWARLVASDTVARSVRTDLLGPSVASVQAGVTAGIVAVIVVLPLAVLTVRRRQRAAGVAGALVVAGFALPGVVTALAVVLATRGTSLYLSFAVLIGAYVLHFGGQALRSAQAAVGAVPSRLDEAARLLGVPLWRRLLRIELPLMLPGLAAGGGLVMMSVLKELPITLILRPTGFDTLPLRISNTYDQVLRVDTGITSLILIGLSAVLTWLLVIRRLEHLR
ncbi:MAG: iron ABC transporter permease [Actinomycetota bacterium]|nr:iron ABC transporter permease [Actinomycetota bacterium]